MWSIKIVDLVIITEKYIEAKKEQDTLSNNEKKNKDNENQMFIAISA